MQQRVQMGPMRSTLLPVVQHCIQHNAACHSHELRRIAASLRTCTALCSSS